MKKLFTILSFCLISLCVNADSIYTRHGNTFVTEKNAPPVTCTQYKWTDTDGKTYSIYMTSKSCYIIKISKKGNEYKKYLPKAVFSEISKELQSKKLTK